MNTEHAGQFKKIISHIYRQFTDIEFVFFSKQKYGCSENDEEGHFELRATTPNLMMTARIRFHPDQYTIECVTDNTTAAHTYPHAFVCDSYRLHLVTKHISGLVKRLSVSMCNDGTSFTLSLYASHLHERFGLVCSPSSVSPHASKDSLDACILSRLYIPAYPFREILLRLEDLFDAICLAAAYHSENCYVLDVQAATADVECETSIPIKVQLCDDRSEGDSSSTFLYEPYNIGKYPHCALLHMADLATLAQDSTLHVFLYQDSPHLHVGLFLANATDARFVCAPCL